MRKFFEALTVKVAGTHNRPEAPSSKSLSICGKKTLACGHGANWQNVHFGYCNAVHVIAVQIVPTSAPQNGLWISLLFAQNTSRYAVEIWHQAAENASVLEAPELQYSVDLGVARVVDFAWLPISFDSHENTLGVCTLLREKALLTSVLVRSAPSRRCVAELSGFTMIESVKEKDTVALQWATDGRTVEGTVLLVLFACGRIAVFRPSNTESPNRLSLTLVYRIQKPQVDVVHNPCVPHCPWAVGRSRRPGTLRGCLLRENHRYLLRAHSLYLV